MKNQGVRVREKKKRTVQRKKDKDRKQSSSLAYACERASVRCHFSPTKRRKRSKKKKEPV